MSHDEKRGAEQGTTKDADLQVVRTEHADSVFHNGTPAQSAESEPDEPGELRQRARVRAAWDFADILNELRISRRCIAERHVHVDEATVRKMCSGDKPIGIGDLELLPEAVAVKLVRRVLARRGIKL